MQYYFGVAFVLGPIFGMWPRHHESASFGAALCGNKPTGAPGGQFPEKETRQSEKATARSEHSTPASEKKPDMFFRGNKESDLYLQSILLIKGTYSTGLLVP